jgi:hypothetical protein
LGDRSESVSVNEQGGGGSDEDVEDQSGHGERHQALEAGFEADREAREDEHDEAEESQEDSHWITPVLLRGGDGFITAHVEVALVRARKGQLPVCTEIFLPLARGELFIYILHTLLLK